jgi:release factor glutamine methyltransferase
VYPPSEDTYLLIDSISLTEKDSFLEVGCGAGLVTLAAARIAEKVVATDISINAVRNTVENLKRNNLDHQVSVFQGDLLTAFRKPSYFTVIAYNSPYLPQDNTLSGIDQATIGGQKGTEISERFLSQVIDHLNQGGRVYLVCSTLADVKKIQCIMEARGLSVRVATSKKMFYEELFVLEGSLLKSYKETVL